MHCANEQQSWLCNPSGSYHVNAFDHGKALEGHAGDLTLCHDRIAKDVSAPFLPKRACPRP